MSSANSDGNVPPLDLRTVLRKAGGQDRVDVGGGMGEWPCVWRRNYPRLREYRGIPAGKGTILYEG